MFILALIDFLIMYVFGLPVFLLYTVLYVALQGWKDPHNSEFFSCYKEGWLWLTEVSFFISFIGWLIVGLIVLILVL